MLNMKANTGTQWMCRMKMRSGGGGASQRAKGDEGLKGDERERERLNRTRGGAHEQ